VGGVGGGAAPGGGGGGGGGGGPPRDMGREAHSGVKPQRGRRGTDSPDEHGALDT
jgi:hypothetical protein